ncbi:MAG: DNA/RNA non-specific endonuclease [Candidatus Methylomirabilales bacterium]
MSTRAAWSSGTWRRRRAHCWRRFWKHRARHGRTPRLELAPSLRAKLAEYDGKVTLSAPEREATLQTHLPWGAPACPTLLPQQAYIVCYSPEGRVALWAAYRLRAEDLVSAERKDAFRTDPRLSVEETASCADYVGSGYDRGHIVPQDDMNRTPATQANTFYLTNMAPQTPSLRTAIPLGAFFGAMFAHGSPSAASVSRFAIGFWAYSLIPLEILEATVVFPRFRTLRDLESRWRLSFPKTHTARSCEASIMQPLARSGDVIRPLPGPRLPGLRRVATLGGSLGQIIASDRRRRHRWCRQTARGRMRRRGADSPEDRRERCVSAIGNYRSGRGRFTQFGCRGAGPRME